MIVCPLWVDAYSIRNFKYHIFHMHVSKNGIFFCLRSIMTQWLSNSKKMCNNKIWVLYERFQNTAPIYFIYFVFNFAGTYGATIWLKRVSKKVDSFIEDSLNFVVFANLAHCASHPFAFNVIKQRSMCFNTFSFVKVLGLLGTLSSSN